MNLDVRLPQEELDRLEREAERWGGKQGLQFKNAIRERRRDRLEASLSRMEDRMFCAGMGLRVEEF